MFIPWLVVARVAVGLTRVIDPCRIIALALLLALVESWREAQPREMLVGTLNVSHTHAIIKPARSFPSSPHATRCPPHSSTHCPSYVHSRCRSLIMTIARCSIMTTREEGRNLCEMSVQVSLSSFIVTKVWCMYLFRAGLWGHPRSRIVQPLWPHSPRRHHPKCRGPKHSPTCIVGNWSYALPSFPQS